MSRERLYTVTTEMDNEIIVLCSTHEEITVWAQVYSNLNCEDPVKMISLICEDYSNNHDPEIPDVDILI